MADDLKLKPSLCATLRPEVTETLLADITRRIVEALTQVDEWVEKAEGDFKVAVVCVESCGRGLDCKGIVSCAAIQPLLQLETG